LLRELGHRVDVTNEWNGNECDLLVALHARRSARSVAEFSGRFPDKSLIVVLTGTDLYRDLPGSLAARESLELATRLVMLQSDGMRYLSTDCRGKTRVIIQSARKPKRQIPTLKRTMEVSVVAHLRRVKDPFRAALASRRLPACSRIRIIQVGRAMSENMQLRAEREAAHNPRYRWLGELPRWQTQQRLQRSQLLVVSSRMEGAPNVASEALAAGVPMLSSQISGMQGLLGSDYPGYFPVGDTGRLAEMMLQAEQDQGFYRRLKQACQRLRHLVCPAREKRLWRQLLQEIC
jgi:putative glycosyltransferase (TIGR04348 family)